MVIKYYYTSDTYYGLCIVMHGMNGLKKGEKGVYGEQYLI